MDLQRTRKDLKPIDPLSVPLHVLHHFSVLESLKTDVWCGDFVRDLVFGRAKNANAAKENETLPTLYRRGLEEYAARGV